MSAIVGGAEGPASVSLPQTAGAMLRAARQQRGLHIAALAVMLKVPQAKLEAIESDRLADLPDATFARALAKAMCQALKIDATPILALLPKTSEPGLDRVNLGLNQPFRERSMRDEGRFTLADLQRPMFWAPLVLLAAAALVYFMPANWLTLPAAEPAASEPVVSAPVQAVSAPEPASENALSVLSTGAPALVPTAAPGASAVNPAAAPASTNVQAAATAVPLVPSATAVPSVPASALTAPSVAKTPAAIAPASSALAPAEGAAFRLGAIADTWIEVVDAHGRLRMSRLVKKGERVEFDIAVPIKLRVGNVAGTEVWLRGVQVDLAGQSHDNVARLDLE